MKAFRYTLLTGALGTLLLGAGCGSKSSGSGNDNKNPGSITANYIFDGQEAPVRVNMFLIDGESSKQTCQNLPYNPTQGVIRQQSNLPVQGAAGFQNVPSGNKWMLFAVGFANNGARVAEACRDLITITEKQTTEVELTLLNKALEMSGTYRTTMKLELELPRDVQQTLVAIDLACKALDLDDVCDISDALVDVLLDLDVDATWNLTHSNEVVVGRLTWDKVEGEDVSRFDLIKGDFTAEVPGATRLQFKYHDIEIQTDQLILFVIEDVLKYDLDSMGSLVSNVLDALSEELVRDIVITKASGTAVDLNNDGRADRINGVMDAEIEFPVADLVHDFKINYSAVK